jgi:hypothetical protein
MPPLVWRYLTALLYDRISGRCMMLAEAVRKLCRMTSGRDGCQRLGLGQHSWSSPCARSSSAHEGIS